MMAFYTHFGLQYLSIYVVVLVWLQPATKAPRGHPSPRRGAEENGKKQAEKLVGRDKGSLTEQQTEGTGRTTIQIRRKHNTNRTTHRTVLPDQTAAVPSRAAREPPPTGTQHDCTWYGIPCSVWPGGFSPPGCAPSWSLVKINPVLAEPRTVV